jgi:hypothetical protein
LLRVYRPLRSRLVVITAFALLLGLVSASAALGAWSGAVDLSASGENGRAPQAAVAPDGTATAVWARDMGADKIIQERRIAPSGALGAVHDLSATGNDAELPRVAVAPDGTATVAWDRFNGAETIVQERRIAPDGTPDATTHDLSATGQYGSDAHVAVAPDGTANVIWQRNDGANDIEQERQIAPNGTPEVTTRDLSATGNDADRPQIAVAPDGTATAVWERSDGTDIRVQERRVAPNGTPDATTNTLSASGEGGRVAQVAVAADGTSFVVWRRSDGTNNIIQERRITSAGVMDATTNDLSAALQDADEPHVAVGPDGTATAVWNRSNGTNTIIQERRIAAGGTPDATTNDLSATGQFADSAQAAVGSDGVATVVWSRFNGTSRITQARQIAANGTPAADTANLSATGHSADDQALGVGGGLAYALWDRSDGTDDRIQLSLFPAPTSPPEPAAPGAGPQGTAAGPTGQQAAALKKCKKKKSATARKKCKKKARKLPV